MMRQDSLENNINISNDSKEYPPQQNNNIDNVFEVNNFQQEAVIITGSTIGFVPPATPFSPL